MVERNVVAIGASSGGLEALQVLVSQVPADFPAPIFVVWHLAREHPSQLAPALAHFTPLPVTQAVDGEAIEPGHIYVARPDHHLVVDGERLRVTRGPLENGVRPSIDVLFRSAALSFGGHVIGIILSGALDDGVSGAFAVKERGGTTIIQDPIDALYADLPLNVLEALKTDFMLSEVDYVLPVLQIGEMLKRLAESAKEPVEDAVEHSVEELSEQPVEDSVDAVAEGEGDEMLSRLEIEVSIAREDHALTHGVLDLGTPSIFTCPECHGVLLQIREGHRTRFRCHTGHAFSSNTLLSELTRSVEEGLWSTVRGIEETEMLLRHLSAHFQQAGQPETAELYQQQANRAHQKSSRVRQVALDAEVLSEDKIEREPSRENPPPQNPSPQSSE